MAIVPFDASKAVTFDLPHGQVHLADSARGVLVPAEALVELCKSAAPESVANFARAVGDAMGRCIRGKLSSDDGGVREAPLDVVVDHLAGQWALAGLGTLQIERWGRALVVVVDDAPSGENTDGLLAPLMAAAISRITDARVNAVRLHREELRARFLVTSDHGAQRVRDWLGSGVPWSEALVRLHDRASKKSRGDA